jgi:hypothetical protein
VPTHAMIAEATYPGEVLFVCRDAACGRKVVIRRREMVVLDRGDPSAQHFGTLTPPELVCELTHIDVER